MTYNQGHVKRDPDSGSVAIRTQFDDSVPELAAMAWLVATVNVGARHAKTEDVDAWDDLYTAP